MSDIDLQFTWWQIGFMLLAFGFWPLSVAAAAAALWWWRQRTSRVARTVAAAVVGLWAICGAANLLLIAGRIKDQAETDATLRARQSTVAQDTVIGGMRLPPGTVVTRGEESTDEIAAVDLPIAADVGGVPVIGHVQLASGALDGEVTLAHDTRIAGVACSASEAARFYDGKLMACRLAEPSRVRGVPCSGTIDLESGIVCVLAEDYQRFGYTWHAQTKLTDYGDLVWFRTGALAPSLRVFGLPLGADSEVEFTRGQIASVDLRNAPAHYRGCRIELILVNNGMVTGQASGSCTLPQLAPGTVKLPSTVLGAR